MQEFIKYNIPEWSLCYLINGDESGIEDEEVKMIDSWCKREGIIFVSPSDEEPSFNPFPEFGKACDTVTCECLVEKGE